MKKLFSFALLVAGFILMSSVMGQSSQRVKAVSAGDWKPGRIIDDAIFQNKGSMTVGQIQQFLDSKVPSCDTNGSQLMWSGGPSRAQWAIDNGRDQAPYTCLKNYVENPTTKQNNARDPNIVVPGGLSAAQLIYNASQAQNINPQVYLVLLQKEQSLVTDDWPFASQFEKATGNNCPDTAPCNPAFAWLWTQVNNSGAQFNYYVSHFDQYNYAPGWNNILVNPNSSCGTQQVFIENAYTAALYIYTPYVPNQAALNNMYGTGDSCSAYGNRNFWRMFNDWFGSTISDEYYWSVARDTANGNVYIATTYGLHYIPDVATMTAWGLSSTPVIEPSQDFFSRRTVGSPVSRLIRDNFGNLFVVDSGKRHYVSSPQLLQLWGIDINSAITVAGYSNRLIDSTWLSPCTRLTSDNSYWIVDSGVRKALSSNELTTAWGCTEASSIELSSWLLNTVPTGGAAERFAQVGTKKALIDQGTMWSDDKNTVDFYTPTGQTFTPISTLLSSLLPQKTINHFAEDLSTGQWFIIEPGVKHYIPSINVANVWGIDIFGGRSRLSMTAMSVFTNGSVASIAAQSSSPNFYYLMDGATKHYIPDATSIDEWLLPATSVIVVSNSLLDRYSTGDPLLTPVAKDHSGQTYIMQAGKKSKLRDTYSDSWTLQPVKISANLSNATTLTPDSSFVTTDGTNFYALIERKRYQIPGTLTDSWNLSIATSILPQTLARYPIDPQVLQPNVSIAGRVYGLSKLEKTELSNITRILLPPSSISVVSKDLFGLSAQKSTYLLRSTDLADHRLWIVGSQGKILLPSVAHALNLGYISRSVELTRLGPDVISSIPTDTATASLIIRSASTGSMKLVSFGESLSLPNSDIALAYLTISGSVITVPQEVFDSLPLGPRYATRLIRDDSGKIYWIDSGKKRWILNGSLLNTVFLGVQQTYLNSTVITLIPDGQPIN